MKTKSNKASLLIGVSVASSFFSWFNFSPEAVVFAMPPQKVVLQSDSGNYLGRCNDCVPRGAYPDSAFVHVLQGDLMNSPWAQFDVKQLPNGNYVLQSDNGKYLSRCNDCVPGALNPDSAFMQSPKNGFIDAP